MSEYFRSLLRDAQKEEEDARDDIIRQFRWYLVEQDRLMPCSGSWMQSMVGATVAANSS